MMRAPLPHRAEPGLSAQQARERESQRPARTGPVTGVVVSPPVSPLRVVPILWPYVLGGVARPAEAIRREGCRPLVTGWDRSPTSTRVPAEVTTGWPSVGEGASA